MSTNRSNNENEPIYIQLNLKGLLRDQTTIYQRKALVTLFLNLGMGIVCTQYAKGYHWLKIFLPEFSSPTLRLESSLSALKICCETHQHGILPQQQFNSLSYDFITEKNAKLIIGTRKAKLHSEIENLQHTFSLFTIYTSGS